MFRRAGNGATVYKPNKGFCSPLIKTQLALLTCEC
jgi:hypothetical protein